MKILFFIDSFDGGGAARLISMIANGLSNHGHKVFIASDFNRPVKYNLNTSIERLSWYPRDYSSKNVFFKLFSILKRGRLIIKQVEPDIAISSIPHIVFLSKLCAIGTHIPFVFADMTSYARKDSSFSHFIRYHFYKLADAITVQTENDMKIIGKRFPQMHVINNPLSYDFYYSRDERDKIILSIGHTKEWHIKGMDILIRAFAKVASNYPDWNVEIAGGTTEDSIHYLEGIIKEEQIEGRIKFIGFQDHIEKKMQAASIFALSSRIEGFSISLTEAISQGCPAVAFKIHGVITDVTGNGHGVLLVEDESEEQFSQQLSLLMSDKELRRELASDGQKYIEKYRLDNIIIKWEELLERVIYQ